jgi:predicted CoA-binding protein
MPGKIITDDSEIKNLLENAKTIAVLGLSPKKERDSFIVAQYLQKKGYKIIPIRPNLEEILGEKAHNSLNDLRGNVDIIDVFRNPAQIPIHAKEAIAVKPGCFWMQLGIENAEAAEMLTKEGIDVIMDRCIKKEHERLF